jgi:hypothetical protein
MESIKYNDKALEIKPADSDIWYNKGNAFYQITSLLKLNN